MLFALTGVNIVWSSTRKSIVSFSYAPKRPSPFFLYIPTKTLFSTIEYQLTVEFLSANG